MTVELLRERFDGEPRFARTAPCGIATDALGVRFWLDRRNRVITTLAARLRRGCQPVWGVRDVSLAIGPGEGVALVGPTGAGKSTLLRACAGVLPADSGRVTVSGRLGTLLSVEAGLLPVLTGRENALLLGVLSGLSRRESRASLDAVAAHSGLDDAFDRPVAAYSLGMRARLGFAVAEVSGADVLLLDEVHEALDDAFRRRLAEYCQRVRSRGGIVMAAGHDHAMLERLCERAVWLDRGSVRAEGALAAVLEAYHAEP